MNRRPAKDDPVREALDKLSIFSRLNSRNRRKLAKLCNLKSFAAGDMIVEEGTIGLSLFILTSGQAEIFKRSDGQKVPLGKVEAGGVLGETALIADQPRSASAVALEPTECLLLTRDGFDTLVKRDPAIAWCLVPGVAARVRDLEGLTVALERAHEQEERTADRGTRSDGAKRTKAKEPERKVEKREESNEPEADDAEPSTLESALLKAMRMQFGVMAGTAKGMTEMAGMMETLLDSLADESNLRSAETWRDLFEKVPSAMVTAFRSTLDDGGKIPKEILDAYRRHNDGES